MGGSNVQRCVSILYKGSMSAVKHCKRETKW